MYAKETDLIQDITHIMLYGTVKDESNKKWDKKYKTEPIYKVLFRWNINVDSKFHTVSEE